MESPETDADAPKNNSEQREQAPKPYINEKIEREDGYLDEADLLEAIRIRLLEEGVFREDLLFTGHATVSGEAGGRSETFALTLGEYQTELDYGRHDETPLYYASTASEGTRPTITVYDPGKLQLKPKTANIYIARSGESVDVARIADFDVSGWLE